MNDVDARMDRLRRAARYRYERLVESEIERGSLDPDEVREERRLLRAKDVGQHARALIEEAERRGVFEDNPYHGKPLPSNDGRHDPDWWIRSKIEREQITGIAPPAFALKKEDAELDGQLDALSTEADVRDVLEDFNARVKEARRQLLGGPPVLFTSSGLGDHLVEGVRRELFDGFFAGPPETWEAAQDAFHRHRWPGRGHLSVNMTRATARTVSFARVDVGPAGVAFAYHPAAPDRPAETVAVELPPAGGVPPVT